MIFLIGMSKSLERNRPDSDEISGLLKATPFVHRNALCGRICFRVSQVAIGMVFPRLLRSMPRFSLPVARLLPTARQKARPRDSDRGRGAKKQDSVRTRCLYIKSCLAGG